MDDLNEYQKKAAEYNGKHLLVLAGAGTGKTKTIIARAEYLLKNGVQPNKIVILSFTRKSAQEIAERIKMSVSGQFNASAILGRTFHSWCNEIMHVYSDYFLLLARVCNSCPHNFLTRFYEYKIQISKP